MVKIFKITFSYLVIFCLFDLALGAFINSQKVYVWNPSFHHGLLVDFDGKGIWGGVDTEVVTNSLGMRDCCARPVTPSTSKHRILIVGDSFTQGVGVNYASSFVGQISSELEQKFPQKIEVLNAGVVSYSPKLINLKLKYLLDEENLHFDELHVFIDISDAYDELEYELWRPTKSNSPRAIYFSTREFLRRWSFVFANFLIEPLDNLVRTVKHNVGNLPGAGDSDTEIGRRAQQVSSATKTIIRRPNRGVWDLNVTPRNDIAAFKGGWTYDREQFNAWAAYGLELAAINMQKVIERMKLEGVAITIHVYPWPQQIENKNFPSIQEQYWRQFASQQGIAFVSHFATFEPVERSAKNLIEDFFIPGDVHWNASGHAEIAKTFLNNWCSNQQAFSCP